MRHTANLQAPAAHKARDQSVTAKRRKATPQKNTLEQLYATHRGKASDKWSSYLTEYERIFGEYRDKPVRLLEIGVQNGGSLEIWPKFFPKTKKIVGCDINPHCANLSYDDARIAVVIGDANSDAAQEAILGHAPALDIIIDDGSHRSSDLVKSFARYFPHLAFGGVFIAEDLHCSYWRAFEGGLYHPFSSITFFKRIADTVNHEHWGIAKPRTEILSGFFSKYGFRISEEALQTVHSVQFMNSLCVVRKEAPEHNRVNRRAIAGSVAAILPEVLEWHSRPTPLSDQAGNEWTARSMPPDEELPLRLNELAEREKRITSLNQVVTERDQHITTLNQTITERDERITTFDQAVAERDGRITSLIQTLSEREAEIERLSGTLSERAAEIEKLSGTLSERDAEVERLSAELKAKDKDLAQRTAEVARLRNEIRWIATSWSALVGQRVKSDMARFDLRHRLVLLPFKALSPALLGARKRLGKLRQRRARRTDYLSIQHSGLFDAAWYLKQHPDVAAAGVDPLRHYLLFGAREGRDPNPVFDTSWYLMQYRDVAGRGVNPLVHYVRFGAAEGRDPGPLTEAKPHLADHADVAAWIGRPRRHSDEKQSVIAYQSHNLKWQGAPNSLFEIAAGIARRNGFHPAVISCADGPLSRIYREQGIYVLIHNFPDRGLPKIDEYERRLDALAQTYDGLGARLVHANTLRSFFAVLAAHRAGIPSVWNVRESEDPDHYFDYLPDRLREMAYSCFSLADKVVFVAEATRQIWKGYEVGNRFSVVPNSLDVERMMRRVYGTDRTHVRLSIGAREDDVVLLSVGTVSQRKAQADLVDAIGKLDPSVRKRLILIMIGFVESKYSNSIRKRLDAFKRDDLIRVRMFDETCTEEEAIVVAESYLAADMFVLCSRVESYPRVMLEAMTFGLSIISTPCFGATEQVVDGQSGLIYRPGDVDTLAQHISRLCRDKDLRLELGQAANERLAALNSYDGMLEGYERIYNSILRH